MLAMQVEYLTGRIIASTYENRSVVEWPPHPSRLFAAMVAAYKEGDLGDEARIALEWLEGLSAPSIYVNPAEHGGEFRDVNEVYVPVNDPRENTLSVIPERRTKQGRWFPSFTPKDRHVWFIWDDDDEEGQNHKKALQCIAENMTYLGHSMTPVRVRMDDEPPEPILIPDANGQLYLRTTGKGRLRHLEEVYDRRLRNATVQPRLGRVSRYKILGKQKQHVQSSIYKHGFAFKKKSKGVGLPLESTAKLSAVVRKAVMNLYPDPVPEVISGHEPNLTPSKRAHLAITPLADVGHRYAKGHIMGFALWLPADTSENVLSLLENALSDLSLLTLGNYGVWEVEPINAYAISRAAMGLRLGTYTRPCQTWATVTPAIFGKFPKRSQFGPGKNGGKVLTELCEMIGLPKPVEARIGSVSAFYGAPNAQAFRSPVKYQDRLKTHMIIRFENSVKGPVLIGAGRYSGFGICRPWFERAAA